MTGFSIPDAIGGPGLAPGTRWRPAQCLIRGAVGRQDARAGENWRGSPPGYNGPPGAGIQSTRRTGRHDCSQGRRMQGAQVVPSIHMRAGRWLSGWRSGAMAGFDVSGGLCRHVSSGSGGTVAAGSCRVRKHRCRPHASRSRQRGKRLRKRTLAATPAVAGMQSPWRAPAPQDGSTIAARVAAQEHGCPL